MGRTQNPCCHLVAIPYPGRGHINPMMNLCKLLVSNDVRIRVSFVVTEEWLGLIDSTALPLRITFQTIPNVIPSEHIRASIFPEFVKAVFTKMEAPVEQLIDERLVGESLGVSAIIADTYVPWAVGLGTRKNIPVVSLWPMSPSVFSIFYHFHLLRQNGHFPANLVERGEEIIDYIPGITETRLADLPTIFSGTGKQVLGDVLEAFSCMRKAQCVLFTSFYELECKVIEELKATLEVPVYCLGPLIPYSTLSSTNNSSMDYFKWLNSQHKESVLYISLGSFLSVSKEQMEEIVQGVRDSGVMYLWVARDNTSQIQEACGEKGLVVPWCDQLKVLCHSSVGGFWTHCGWNSTLEGVFAGVPMLTFPIFWDQVPDGKQIVDDWEIGIRVKKGATEQVVRRHEISAIIQKLMGSDDNESREMRRKAGELKEMCRQALSKDGSSEANMDNFVKTFLKM